MTTEQQEQTALVNSIVLHLWEINKVTQSPRIVRHTHSIFVLLKALSNQLKLNVKLGNVVIVEERA